MRKTVIAKLVAEGEITAEGGHFEVVGTDVLLTYVVKSSLGLTQRGLRFSGVRAFQFRGEPECTPWHITDVYERLAEVSDSVWLADLRQTKSAQRAAWPMHHYMLYREDVGCYEVAAGAWSWIPELNI
jgi:hypothetical protein